MNKILNIKGKIIEVKQEKMSDIFYISSLLRNDDFNLEYSGFSYELSKKELINKLNYLNFFNGKLTVIFKHLTFNHIFTLFAIPKPCFDDRLICLWDGNLNISEILKNYKFESLLIYDDNQNLLLYPSIIQTDNRSVTFLLPDKCYGINLRKANRHKCKKLNVRMIQKGVEFKGFFADFSSETFRIKLKSSNVNSFKWINTENPVSITVYDKKNVIYSGDCSIIKQSYGEMERFIILKSVSNNIQRYSAREYRSTRQQLEPLPYIIFEHPFTGRLVNLNVIDISGSGFSVEEYEDRLLLVPGLILNKAELNFANSFRTKCVVQVLYSKEIECEDGKKRMRYGIAILDMDIQDHLKLISVLYQAQDPNSYICSRIDMNSLWKFFFDTGFIYPEKYKYLELNKEEIKLNYEKLYNNNPNIARHFIYMERNTIYGHVSMLRFYNNSWMIHHYAARKDIPGKASISLLFQMYRYTYDTHRLASSHMDYLLFYYRPNNKFPERIFGGAARHINDPDICSLDRFAFVYSKNMKSVSKIPEDYTVEPADDKDMLALYSYYKSVSNGLLIKALDLDFNNIDQVQLDREYKKIGFKHERHIYSIRKNGIVAAIIIITISDIGLNMSDLTNCIKAFIINENMIVPKILNRSILDIFKQHSCRDMPILMYPVSYAKEKSINYEKEYNLWIFNTRYSDEYFKYSTKLFSRIAKRIKPK